MSLFNFLKKKKSSSNLTIDIEVAIRSGDFNKAMKLCSEGIELYPNEVNFYLKRALASRLGESVKFGIVDNNKITLRLQDYDKAIALLESDSYPIEYFSNVLAKAYFDRAAERNLLNDNDGAKSDALKSRGLGYPESEIDTLMIDLD